MCVVCVGVCAHQQAGRLFKQLLDLGQEVLHKGGLDFKKLEMHGKFCTDMMPKVRVSCVCMCVS